MSIDTSNFFVIGVCSNPRQFQSRYRLYRAFMEHMKECGAQLITVEMAFGGRPFVLTEPHNSMHLQVRSIDELWHKENMINLGIQYLTKMYPGWKQVAWIDGDITFVNRENWVSNAVKMLDHYQFIQLWENAVDLGPDGQTLATHYSFMSQYIKGKPYNYKKSDKYGAQWHPGYAWCANREAIDHVGQLIDFALLGAGDNHMAHGLINKLDGTLAKGLHPNYIQKLQLWQAQAERYIRRDVGYLPETILAGFHGRKALRGYHDRWQVLVRNQFNPDTDIKRDSYGLWQLVDHGDERSIHLRDDVRAYFNSRNEDSIDLV